LEVAAGQSAKPAKKSSTGVLLPPLIAIMLSNSEFATMNATEYQLLGNAGTVMFVSKTQ
jgi:hypothetical protein